MSLSSLEVSSRGASGSKGITVDKSSGAANLTARLRFIRGIDKAVIVAEVVAEEIEEEETCYKQYNESSEAHGWGRVFLGGVFF